MNTALTTIGFAAQLINPQTIAQAATIVAAAIIVVSWSLMAYWGIKNRKTILS